MLCVNLMKSLKNMVILMPADNLYKVDPSRREILEISNFYEENDLTAMDLHGILTKVF